MKKLSIELPSWLQLLLFMLGAIGFFIGCAVTGIDPEQVFLTLARWAMVAIILLGTIAALVLVLGILFGKRR